MPFWSKKTNEPSEEASENPYRALDSPAFDKGERINRGADAIRRYAASGNLIGSEVIVALQYALGGGYPT